MTGLKGKKDVTKKKAADKLANIVKIYKNIRETSNHTRWSVEEAKPTQ